MRGKKTFKPWLNSSNIYKYYVVKEIQDNSEFEKQLSNRSMYPQSPDTWRLIQKKTDTLNASQESKGVNASSKHLTSYQNTNINIDGGKSAENDNILGSSPFGIIQVEGKKLRLWY